MKWTLSELRRYVDEPMHLQKQLELNDAMKARFPDQILAVAPVKIDGSVMYERGDATIFATVKTTVTVPSTRSLTPVELPLDFSFTESYTNDQTHLDRYEEAQTLAFLLDDAQTPIDFEEAVMENIIEQIPSRVLTSLEAAGNSMPQGKGWDVQEEGAVASEANDSVDPRLAKLKELFPDQDSKH